MAHFILFITGKHLHSFIPPLFFPSIVLKQWSYSYYPIPFCPVLSHFNATYNCIQSPAVADKKYSYHSFVSPYFAPECKSCSKLQKRLYDIRTSACSMSRSSISSRKGIKSKTYHNKEVAYPHSQELSLDIVPQYFHF